MALFLLCSVTLSLQNMLLTYFSESKITNYKFLSKKLGYTLLFWWTIVFGKLWALRNLKATLRVMVFVFFIGYWFSNSSKWFMYQKLPVEFDVPLNLIFKKNFGFYKNAWALLEFDKTSQFVNLVHKNQLWTQMRFATKFSLKSGCDTKK